MDYLVTVGPVRKNFSRPPGNLRGAGGSVTSACFHAQQLQAEFAGSQSIQIFGKARRP